MKDTATSTTSCVSATYINTSISIKYTVIGKTDDITYDLKNKTTLASIQLSNAPISYCTNSTYNYQYYGNFFNSDVILLTHPALSDPLIRFWKVKFS